MDRDRGRIILSVIKSDIKKNYYDPNFYGVDIEVRFKEADEKVKQAASLGQILGIIAQTLIDLNDSHTYFLPPDRPYTTDYGWQMRRREELRRGGQTGSDAAAKGLKEGDEIYSIDGFGATRENMWKIHYFYNALRPKPGMRLVVIKPTGQEQQLDALAKVTPGKRVMDLTGGDIYDLIRKEENENRLHRHRYIEMGADVFIWKMPSFDLEDSKVDDMASKFRRRKALILDLRGNGGGYESTLLRLVSNLFDRDIKVGELKRRKETKPIEAKTRGDNAFDGKLIVLIDSQSGSAAELLARIVQLEKRGIVIGDRSAGAVMRAKTYGHELGIDTVIPYGVSITDADIVMSDGKSLERVGVVPDEIRLAKGADMAAKRDPVLSYAALLAGITLTAEKAGTCFSG
jgi:C-terminal processing protease CtpA/Prc